MLRMGERIRNRRESLSIQINDLANLIGVTPSLISQIERAKAFPSIVTLKKLADALQTTVGNLIGESESYSKNPHVLFANKKFVQQNETGASLFLLSHHDQQKLMEPHLLIFGVNSNSSNLINPLSGQSFYYVLNGKFSIDWNFQEYRICHGDSFYINSSYRHNIQNIGDTEAMLLWISTNPIL